MRPAYPQLAVAERVVAEVALGADMAVLTDRRVIVAGRRAEQSVPLAHIALVAVRFERPGRKFVIGGVLVVLALMLLAIASPLRTFLLESSAALEPAASQEREQAEGGQRLAHGMQRIAGGLASVVRVFPLGGWLALGIGIAVIVFGVIGRTVVIVASGGGEVFIEKRGNDRALHDFVAEVARNLPGPERIDTLDARTIPLPGMERR